MATFHYAIFVRWFVRDFERHLSNGHKIANFLEASLEFYRGGFLELQVMELLRDIYRAFDGRLHAHHKEAFQIGPEAFLAGELLRRGYVFWRGSIWRQCATTGWWTWVM